MSNVKNRLLACSLSAAMAVSGFAGMGSVAVSAAEPATSGVVNPITLEYAVDETTTVTNQAYVYVPQGDGIDVGHNATWKPIMIVYGDYADEAAVLKEAQKDGLAELAAEEECVVMYITKSGDTWTENDKYSYIAAMLEYSDSTNYSYDATTGLSDQDGVYYYPGYSERSYVFAADDAADFVSTYVVAGTEATINYSTSFAKPAAVYLSNVKAAAEKIETSRSSAVDMPAYLVNASKSVIAAYKGYNSDASYVATAKSKAKSGLNASDVKKGWNALVKNYHRQKDVIMPITDYTKTANETECHYTCADGTVIEYYTYVPVGLENAKKGSLPLVVGFHGNGNSALTMAHLDEWPELACQEGFIYIGVNKHEALTDAEVMEMLEAYVASNASINTAKIYCTGFSQGAMRTASLTWSAEYGSFFAAASPQNILYSGNYSAREELTDSTNIIPTYYIGGITSHIREMINNYTMGFWVVGDVEDELAYLLERNDVAFTYANDGTGYWGITDDAATITTATSKYLDDVNYEITSIKSTDGNCYTKLVASSLGHEYSEMYSVMSWEFMSQFSRADDGSVIIDAKANGLANKPAKDGNWYYYKNGKIDKTYNGVVKNKNGWWKVTNGKVDFKYTGIASNENGKWYIQKGKVNFNKTGKISYKGKTYKVVKGKVK